MAIQIVFSKSDDAPWGFRLTGGADCEIPLTVIKITEGGIADAAGLLVDDVVININDRNADDLSHIEAHDVLMEAGTNFIMAVARNHVNHLHDDEHHNEEVRHILQQTISDENQHQFQPSSDEHTVTEIITKSEIHPKQRVHFDDGLQGSEPTEVTMKQHDKLLQETHPKKWSTFLQKPSRPVVLPTKTISEAPAAEPYRVIIKKQPKKSAQKIENVCFEEEQIVAEPQGTTTEEAQDETGPEEELHSEPELDDDEQQPTIEEIYEEEEENDVDQTTPEVEQDSEKVELEKHVSLEEQLAQIQQQLQSLAQVPTSIQNTLEVLTEQLAKIVGVSQTHRDLEQQDVPYDEEDERLSYEDEDLPVITEENPEALDSNDEYKLDQTDTTDISGDEAELNSQNDPEELDSNSYEEELKRKLAEEAEQEREKQELEKFVKQERTEEFHQRRLEQRPTVPLAPVQRPIILPGGRKWSEPDDALPKPRKSKMTDEKICETLDNYSEIVTGHTKGINFLKYQPAPKNLDYLKRSEVFRLIHDTDPPKSGIAARSGMVVSEEDYYGNIRFDPEQRSSVKV